VNKNRLEAFSDGVLAIIITIMVLELRAPKGASWSSIILLLPVFFSYIISFTLVGIYWGNHHHLLHGAKKVNGKMMLANLLLLFFLSLVPPATAWMGINSFAPNTIILYSAVLVACGVSYALLQQIILKDIPKHDPLLIAIRKQWPKIVASSLMDLAAIPLAYVNPYLSGAMFLGQSIIWLIPDANIEKAIAGSKIDI